MIHDHCKPIDKAGDDLHDINNFDAFSKIVPLKKGMSSDKKDYIETTDGEHLLLHIAEISESDMEFLGFSKRKAFNNGYLGYTFNDS